MRNELQKIGAALILFTRMPWHRLFSIKSEHFAHAAAYWPFAGWITGTVLGVFFWVSALYLPFGIAAIVALAARVLLTGALHEDGLADYLDGMGGGRNREQTLRIMKDSHIGTYGVLGLILYFLLLYNFMQEAFVATYYNLGEGLHTVLLITITFDVWSKCCASLLTALLPYARTAEQAKTQVVYNPLTRIHLLRMAIAMLPSIVLFCFAKEAVNPILLLSLTIPLITLLLLAKQMQNRLQGYTGDCCGATFLLCELTTYLTFAIIYSITL